MTGAPRLAGERDRQMRMSAIALMSACLLASAPVASGATEVLASRAAPAAPIDEFASPTREIRVPPEETDAGFTVQEVATGALLLGGAFAIGLVAGGTLSSAIVSAGTVAIIYALIP